MQRTLVLIKPDGIQRGLAGEIIARLERRGLQIAGAKMLHVSEELARRHYAVHQGKPFFEPLVRFITSTPILALVLEGEKAVQAVRQTMGSTNPLEAPPGTVRGDLGLDIGRNLVHGSDSEETAKAEIALFFSEEELFSYQRDGQRWITEPAPEAPPPARAARAGRAPAPPGQRRER